MKTSSILICKLLVLLLLFTTCEKKTDTDPEPETNYFIGKWEISEFRLTSFVNGELNKEEIVSYTDGHHIKIVEFREDGIGVFHRYDGTSDFFPWYFENGLVMPPIHTVKVIEIVPNIILISWDTDINDDNVNMSALIYSESIQGQRVEYIHTYKLKKL
ncbi:hypothetical protein ES705_31479 [subsurface metagenome]